MPTFPLYDIPYLRTTRERTHAAHQRAITADTPTIPIRMQHTAADGLSLRGIPAVGRDCPGRIAGTRPDQICDW